MYVTNQSYAAYNRVRANGAASPKAGGTENDIGTPAVKQSATDAFLAEAHKTPAQRMREELLKSLGLTEDKLDAMPAEQKAAVEKKLADEMKRRLETGDRNARRGAAVDLTA